MIMKYILATVGAVTSAVRLKKAAESMGMPKAAVVHTPASLNKGGCSYSLRFESGYLDIVKDASVRAHIPVKGYYGEIRDGRERVFHALS